MAGFLAKAGFFAGEDEDLLEAAEDNPKGFFERADVNALNDNFLAELDGAWDRPPGRELILEQARRRGGLRSTRCSAAWRQRRRAGRWC